MNTPPENLYCPTQQKLFFATMRESFPIPVKDLAGGIKYTVNTARQALQSLDPLDKSLNHTTMAADRAHSHTAT